MCVFSIFSLGDVSMCGYERFYEVSVVNKLERIAEALEKISKELARLNEKLEKVDKHLEELHQAIYGLPDALH